MDALGNTNALAGRLSGLMLGSTPAGSAWAYKALHPSDTVVGIGGVPDKSCLYTTFQNYMQQVSINPTELLGIVINAETNATPMWSMDIIQSPHPLYPLRIRLWRDDTPSNVKDFVVYNNQLGVNLEDSKNAFSFVQKLNEAFMHNFEKYRIAYQGVTINSTASEMFNQGNVTATQYTWPVTYNQNFRIESLYDFFTSQPVRNVQYSSVDTPSVSLDPQAAISINPNSIVMTMQCGSAVIRDKMKTYDELIQMPLAYTGVAKLGVYQPLKLTDFSWKKTDDFYYYISDNINVPVNEPANPDTNQNWGLGFLTGGKSSITSASPFDSKSEAGVLPIGSTTENVTIGEDTFKMDIVTVPSVELNRGVAQRALRKAINKTSFTNPSFNFGPLSNLWCRSAPYGYWSDDGADFNYGYTNLNLYPIPAFCGDKFGQISFRGLSSQNPLILTFRQGIETVVTPGSLLSMYSRPSMTPDETALLAYAQIVTVLSDAWPAYYNDRNKLLLKLQEAWNWFKPIGKKMLSAAAPIALDAISSLII